MKKQSYLQDYLMPENYVVMYILAMFHVPSNGRVRVIMVRCLHSLLVAPMLNNIAKDDNDEDAACCFTSYKVNCGLTRHFRQGHILPGHRDFFSQT